MTFYIEHVMMEKTSRMKLACFDSSAMGDKIRETRSIFNAITNISSLVFKIVGGVINTIAAFVLVFEYRWWLGFLCAVFVFPSFIFSKYKTEKQLKMDNEELRERRMLDYYSGVFYDAVKPV